MKRIVGWIIIFGIWILWSIAGFVGWDTLSLNLILASVGAFIGGAILLIER